MYTKLTWKSDSFFTCPRFNCCFDYILPKLPEDIAKKIMKDNVLKMLKCGE